MITIDEDSAVPPFEQVRAQLEQAITMGAISPGTRLPTVRQLAHDLRLAPNTVARSYRALEHAGLVETRGRRGTTVSPVEPASPTRRSRALREAAARYHNEAARIGATLDEALEALRRYVLEEGT